MRRAKWKAVVGAFLVCCISPADDKGIDRNVPSESLNITLETEKVITWKKPQVFFGQDHTVIILVRPTVKFSLPIKLTPIVREGQLPATHSLTATQNIPINGDRSCFDSVCRAFGYVAAAQEGISKTLTVVEKQVGEEKVTASFYESSEETPPRHLKLESRDTRTRPVGLTMVSSKPAEDKFSFYQLQQIACLEKKP